MDVRTRIISGIALLAALALVTSCSSRDAETPTVGIDILELSQLVEGRLNEAVSKGVVSPANKQQFLGNIAAGDSGAIVVGYVKRSRESSVVLAAYPSGTEVEVHLDRPLKS